MSLTAKESGGVDFEITPEGQYVGRCYKIVDMGTQTTTGMYGIKDKHQVMISWELFGKEDDETVVDDDGNITITKEGVPILMQDGRPFSVSQFYTISLSEKANLRRDLEAWRGRKFTPQELEGFDLSNVLDAYCIIQVVHDETGKYANVQTLMKHIGEKPKPVNPNVIFDIDKPDMEVFNNFSDNMKLKIASTPEWKSNHQPAKIEPTKPVEDVVITDFDETEPVNLDDIPF